MQLWFTATFRESEALFQNHEYWTYKAGRLFAPEKNASEAPGSICPADHVSLATRCAAGSMAHAALALGACGWWQEQALAGGKMNERVQMGLYW
jgi:hypothetical protein